MYAKLINGKVKVGVPKTGELSNGRTVSGYNRLPEEILLAEGWVPYVDKRPEYNQETHYARATGYDVRADRIVRTYEVLEIPPAEPEEVEELKQAIADVVELVLEVNSDGST